MTILAGLLLTVGRPATGNDPADDTRDPLTRSEVERIFRKDLRTA